MEADRILKNFKFINPDRDPYKTHLGKYIEFSGL